MKTTTITTLTAAALALTSIGCTEPEPDTQAPDDTDALSRQFEVLTGGAAREESPQVEEADFVQFNSDNADFAFELYHQIRGEQGGKNIFVSPHSISSALAMLYAGARGDTETQMAEALNFSLAHEVLHPSFNKLDRELESRGKNAVAQDGGAFRLRVANAVWGKKGASYLPEFLDTLSKHYGAGLHILDFLNEPETSRQIINAWVEKKTEERITDLIPEGVITPGTAMVLTNAIYFNAAWAQPFDAENTGPRTFVAPEGDVTTDFMGQLGTYSVGEAEDGATVVELPYDGDELSMVILMPADGKFDDTEAALTGASFESYRAVAEPTNSVQLSMPKFEFEFEQELKAALMALGMVDAFGGAADLSGINGVGGLEVAAVLHKAFVAVNEKGTEAAAATAVVIRETSAPAVDQYVTLDRPFIFAIRDNATGSLLFVGRVLDPS